MPNGVVPEGQRLQAEDEVSGLFSLLYRELKRIAAGRVRDIGGGQTLTATSLVHEVWLKLSAADDLQFESRGHFYACAAQAMRQILIDHVRARTSDKRGGPLERVTLSGIVGELATDDLAAAELLDLDCAIGELGQIDPSLQVLVELRYFAGLTLEEITQLQGRSLRTVNRDWQRARAMLATRLRADEA